MTATQSRLIRECAEQLQHNTTELLAFVYMIRDHKFKKNNDGMIRDIILPSIKGGAECIRNNAEFLIKTMTEAGIESSFERVEQTKAGGAE